MGRSLKNIVAGLNPRERRLLLVMSVIFVVFTVFIAGFLFSASVGDLEDESEKLATSLSLINAKAADYKARKQSRLPTKAVGKPTPLRTLVEKISKKLAVDPPDMKELPDMRHGETWIEKAMELTIHRIDILQLTEFMEEIESNRNRFPIAISKLEVNRRKSPTGVTYNVKMTVSTYEQAEATPENEGGGKTRTRKTATPRKGVR